MQNKTKQSTRRNWCLFHYTNFESKSSNKSLLQITKLHIINSFSFEEDCICKMELVSKSDEVSVTVSLSYDKRVFHWASGHRVTAWSLLCSRTGKCQLARDIFTFGAFNYIICQLGKKTLSDSKGKAFTAPTRTEWSIMRNGGRQFNQLICAMESLKVTEFVWRETRMWCFPAFKARFQAILHRLGLTHNQIHLAMLFFLIEIYSPAWMK